MKTVHEKVFLLLSIVISFIAVACSSYGSDLCNTDSPVFQELFNNYDTWSQLQPLNSSNGITTFRTSDQTYAVRILQYTSTGEPIISISTNEGYPRTPLGIRGYFYTPNSEVLNLTDYGLYTITQININPNIYCYEQDD